MSISSTFLVIISMSSFSLANNENERPIILDHIANNNLKAVKQWHEKGGDLSSYSGDLPLIYIALIEECRLDMIQYMIDNGVNVDQPVKGLNETPIFAASGLKDLSCLKYLIKQGANINATTSTGRNAYTSALMNKDKDAIRVLYENGLSPFIKIVNDFDPIQLAVILGKAELFEDILKQHYAKGNPPSFALDNLNQNDNEAR